ncbi:MAG: SusD/RagB family nutrient-binding outer membrane lipoprotein [Roseivirga sp.]|nr:SusD/RagB family nutrient-binding outer membrane lipoprotein [Roseivirga sp.]
MKSYKKLFLSVLALTFIMSSCDLEESNVDPSRPLSVNLNLILPSTLGQTAYNQMALPARQPGIVMQYLTGIDAQQVAYSENYLFTENTFNNYWNFGIYGGVLKDGRDLIALGTEAEQPYYVGIGKILMAEAFGRLTASFGDVPFSDALLGTESLKPAFDTQEQVYDGVQRLLDEAITELSKAAVAGGPAGDDLIFSGDAGLWIQTAHALKARFLMHLTKRRSVYGTVLSELGQAFTTAIDEPRFQWESAITSANPFAKFGIGRPNTLAINPGFGQAMTTRLDPRASKYFELDGTQYNFHNSNNTELIWAQNASLIPLISLVELKLYEAEAKLMTGDAAGAQTALTEAVDASMAQIGVSDAAAIAAYKTAYADLAAGATDQDKLNIIITEAYYALYGHQMHTAWTNFRRTGFPAMTPAANGAGGLDPSGAIPVRWLYPSGEQQTNAVNVDAAIANQGGALLDDNTWAFR